MIASFRHGSSAVGLSGRTTGGAVTGMDAPSASGWSSWEHCRGQYFREVRD